MLNIVVLLIIIIMVAIILLPFNNKFWVYINFEQQVLSMAL